MESYWAELFSDLNARLGRIMNRVRVVVGTLLTKYYCGQGRDLEDFSLHLQDDENCPELRRLRRGIAENDFVIAMEFVS